MRFARVPTVAALAFNASSLRKASPCAGARLLYAAWHAPIHFGRYFVTGFLVAALWVVAPSGAGAQGCENKGGTYGCTVPPGTYSSELSFTAPRDSNGQALPMTVDAQGTVSVPLS